MMQATTDNRAGLWTASHRRSDLWTTREPEAPGWGRETWIGLKSAMPNGRRKAAVPKKIVSGRSQSRHKGAALPPGRLTG